MRVIEIEPNIYRPHNDSRLSWRLHPILPIVEMINFAGQPTNLFRFISFATDSPYIGEIYGEPFFIK